MRSMAGGSSSSVHEDIDEESSAESIQQQAAETVNNSPSAAMPIPTLEQGSAVDLESGREARSPIVTDQHPSWLRAIVGLGHHSTSQSASNTQSDPDRDR